MADRGREFPPDEVDLDSFLYNGTGAQSRALAGLKWLTKAGGLGYDLGGYSFKQDVHRAPKQAAVLEPPMVKILELAIQQRFEAKDPSWRALLGLWCCGFGVLRFVHVNRSRPMRLSKSTFHFHCIKGKQRTVRSGFDFAVPGFFISGWDWGSRWLAEWKELPSGAHQAHSGIAFNEFGVPYTTAQAIKLAQDVFTPAGRVTCPATPSGVLALPMPSWQGGLRRASWPWGTGRIKAELASSRTPWPCITVLPDTLRR